MTRHEFNKICDTAFKAGCFVMNPRGQNLRVLLPQDDFESSFKYDLVYPDTGRLASFSIEGIWSVSSSDIGHANNIADSI